MSGKPKTPAFGPGSSHSFPCLPLSLWRICMWLPGIHMRVVMPVSTPALCAVRIPRSALLGREDCLETKVP
jgi:hypothetical protein